MSVFGLASGTVFRALECKVSKAGKVYCTATLKVAAGAEFVANDGSEKLSRTLMVEGVLPLKSAPRERKPKRDPAPQTAPVATSKPAAPDFDDNLDGLWGGER
jgi:hypothetical protein